MIHIKYILILTSISCIISEISGIMMWVKYFFSIKSMKPLDCPKCFSFWLTLLFYLFYIQEGIFISFGYACISSLLSIYIIRYAK